MPAEVAAPPSPVPAAQPAAVAPTPSAAVSSQAGTGTPSSAEALDKGPDQPTPRKGSAKEKLFQDLRKKAAMEEPAAEPAKPSEEPKPEEEGELTKPSETPATTAEKKGGKVSPWKLVDEHKAARAKAEQELAELRKSMPDPKAQEAMAKEKERYAAIEKRAQELEEEIRFVNYSKSKEFQEKHVRPYEDAWKRWMTDLGELTLTGADGQERPLQPGDLLEVIKMPLAKAREYAETTFGAFADDIMSARKEIKALFDQQQQALENARKEGSEREERMSKEQAERAAASHRELKGLWDKFNEETVSDERIKPMIMPVDGDEDGNARLAKGYELADKAFSMNPLDPRLTPEQRAEAVRLHVAIRHRAAAFGRVAFQLDRARKEISELKAALDKFKAVQPGAGEGTREKPEAGYATAKQAVFGALHKLAH